MNKSEKEAEVRYRLAVILLGSIRDKGLLSNDEYTTLRVELANEFKAPIGLLESENHLWEIE